MGSLIPGRCSYAHPVPVSFRKCCHPTTAAAAAAPGAAAVTTTRTSAAATDTDLVALGDTYLRVGFGVG